MRYTCGILFGSLSLLAGCASISTPTQHDVIAQSEAARVLGGGEAKAPLLSIIALQDSADEEDKGNLADDTNAPGGVSNAPPSSASNSSETAPMIDVEAPALSEPTRRPVIDPSNIPTLEFGEAPKKVPVVVIEGSTKPPPKEPIKYGPSEHQAGSTMLDILKQNSRVYHDQPTFYRTADSVSDSSEWIGRRYSKLLELLNPGH